MNICIKQFYYALALMLGPISFGTIMCYPSPAGNEIRLDHKLPEDSMQWSFYNSISSLFAISGPFVTAGFFHIYRNSRQKVVLTIAAIGTAMWILNCLTKLSIWAGIFIRACLGVVMGAYSSISPIYLVEIAPEGKSGIFGSLNQIGFVIGMVLFDFIGPSLNYNQLNFVGASVCLLQACLIWTIEESPVVEYINADECVDGDVKHESLWQKKHMKGLIAGIFMMLFQQFCGINGLLTNLADVMDNSGLHMNGNYQAGIASCAQLVSVFVDAVIVDIIGRKITWTISCSLITVFLLLFALNEKFQWSNTLPLICIFLYQLGYGLGLGPIPWFIIPEYFNDEVRCMATMVVVTSNWIFSFVIILVWPVMMKGMGMFGSILFFMVISFCAIVFGIFCVDEPVVQNNLVEKEENEEDEKVKKEEEESSSEILPNAL